MLALFSVLINYCIIILLTCGAGEGVDFDSGPYNVTIPAGDTLAVFNVAINDDDIMEANESFILTIDDSSLPNRVNVTDPDQATVTIVDNDDDGKYT